MTSDTEPSRSRDDAAFDLMRIGWKIQDIARILGWPEYYTKHVISLKKEASTFENTEEFLKALDREVGLSTRVYHALLNNFVVRSKHELIELLTNDRPNFLRTPNLGRKSYEELCRAVGIVSSLR